MNELLDRALIEKLLSEQLIQLLADIDLFRFRKYGAGDGERSAASS